MKQTVTLCDPFPPVNASNVEPLERDSAVLAAIAVGYTQSDAVKVAKALKEEG